MEMHRSALVAYAAEDMFDLIERAEHYPAFMPWCVDATILERTDTIVAANIVIAWRGLRFDFTTRNPKRRPEWLAVRLERGPFRRFAGEWRLKALAPQACRIDCAMRYEFDHVLVGRLAQGVFDRLATGFVDAFVHRADVLFGGEARPALPGTTART